MGGMRGGRRGGGGGMIPSFSLSLPAILPSPPPFFFFKENLFFNFPQFYGSQLANLNLSKVYNTTI